MSSDAGTSPTPRQRPQKVVKFGRFSSAVFNYNGRYTINIRRPISEEERDKKYTTPNPESLLLLEDEPVIVSGILNSACEWIMNHKCFGGETPIPPDQRKPAKIIVHGNFSVAIFYYPEDNRYTVNVKLHQPRDDSDKRNVHKESLLIYEEDTLTIAHLLNSVNSWIMRQKTTSGNL